MYKSSTRISAVADLKSGSSKTEKPYLFHSAPSEEFRVFGIVMSLKVVSWTANPANFFVSPFAASMYLFARYVGIGEYYSILVYLNFACVYILVCAILNF